MQRIKVLCVAIMALLALGTVISATASGALPEFLPEATEKTPIKFTAKSGAGTLETVSGSKITCTEGKGEGEITAAKKTIGKGELKGCKSGAVSCNTEGAPTGVIKESGEGLLVYIKKEPKDVGMVGSPKANIKITCGAFLKIEGRGHIIGLITTINKKQKIFTGSLKQTKGVQEFTEYENEKGEKVKAICEISFNGGPFEQCGVEGSGETETEKEVEVMA
jgi:hypothetical protein